MSCGLWARTQVAGRASCCCAVTPVSLSMKTGTSSLLCTGAKRNGLGPEETCGWADEAADPEGRKERAAQMLLDNRPDCLSAKVVLSFHFLPPHLLSLQPLPGGGSV